MVKYLDIIYVFGWQCVFIVVILNELGFDLVDYFMEMVFNKVEYLFMVQQFYDCK